MVLTLPSGWRTIIRHSTFGSDSTSFIPSGQPITLTAVASPSAVAQSGAMTVTLDMCFTGSPVRGSMMWENHFPSTRNPRA